MPSFTTSSNLKIYYEVHGNKGPPLILLHGLSSSSRIWALQVPFFRRYCRVYVFDFPGHGRSERDHDYSIEGFTEVLKEFMEELTINKAHLMGLSVGCAVALTFAANFPDQVQSLILEGPVGGILPPTHPKAWFKVLFHMVFPLLLFLSIILLGHHRTATLINRLGVQSSKRYLLLESIQKEADFKAIRQIIFEIAYPPYVGKLKQIQAPTFIAVGQEDIVPERYYRYIMENIQGPSELMLFSNARHIVALEKPDEYNAAVLNFLKPFLEPFPENASNKLVG